MTQNVNQWEVLPPENSWAICRPAAERGESSLKDDSGSATWERERRETACLVRLENAFQTRQLMRQGIIKTFWSLFLSRCFFVPTKSNPIKSCNNWAGDECKLEISQNQQTGSTEGCCVSEGGASALVSSTALRSNSASQPAGTENTVRLKFFRTGPSASSPTVSWREMFFPCVDGSQLTASPCYVDTAAWCRNHQQGPSITQMKWRIPIWAVMGEHVTGFPLRSSAAGADERF